MKVTNYLFLLLLLVVFSNSAYAQSKSDKPTLVLVHGAWHGGWAWKEVKTTLSKKNYNVYTPTLSGLGQYNHNLNDHISLKTHILDIINLIIMEDLHNVALVGHSYAGAVITGVADSIPKRLNQLIYLDAMLVHNGESPMSSEPLDEQLKKKKTFDKKQHFQPISSRYFGITDSIQVKWVDQRLTPQPYNTFGEILHLNNDFGNGLPMTYIACINPQLEVLKPRSDKLHNDPKWKYLTLDTGHDAMITTPKKLSLMLLDLVEK